MGALVAVGIISLTACGATYIDGQAPDPDDTAPSTTITPIDVDASIDELLIEIQTLMFDLDERIIDHDQATETIDRIEALWLLAEPHIRATALDSVNNFQIPIDMARTGVDRNRPADASKGYKLIIDVIDHYLN